MTREQQLAEVKVEAEAEALCQKILKAMGPQKQIVAMNALYLTIQVVDSVSFRNAEPHNAGGEATGAALCDRSPRP